MAFDYKNRLYRITNSRLIHQYLVNYTFNRLKINELH